MLISSLKLRWGGRVLFENVDAEIELDEQKWKEQNNQYNNTEFETGFELLFSVANERQIQDFKLRFVFGVDELHVDDQGQQVDDLNWKVIPKVK